MTLTPGSRLGPYEITEKLGEGGMGVVFRAKDSLLGREVALKVLPEGLTADPDRAARFEREAKLLAQLNHPNIAQIHGLETQGDTRALVMELVEGPTLAERLEPGSLSLDESLSIARQIADALEEAHEKGIIHRDLKPQNIKAPNEGKVKVLDFGLAKAFDPVGSSAVLPADLANSPTVTFGGTREGVILGTAAYMAPEQARGGAIDKRADIWAFGVVLYEMLTGARLFAEGNVVDTLSAVMRQEIDLGKLPPESPPRLRRLVRRCLERDPKRRLRDIGDARLVLDELRHDSGTDAAPDAPVAAAPSPARLAAVGAAAIVMIGLAVLIGRWTAPSPSAAVGAADAGFHGFTRLTYETGPETSPSLSPDGEFVAYVAFDGGDRDVFLLRVGGQRAINLTEDSPAHEDHPAFSPDGRFVAFRSERAGGGLFVMGATGESVRRLTDFGDNPSWSPDGREIVFATEGESDPHAREKTSELWTVPAAGGEPRRIFAGDAVQPAWSPGGHRIAFWRVVQGTRDVWTIAADGSDPRRVTDATSVDWNPIWARDGEHLYFASDRGGVTTPWRVAIDERTGTLRGEPRQVVLPTAWSGEVSLSADERRMVYRTSEMTAEIRRLPFDSTRGAVVGPVERIFDTAIPAVGLDLSADGWITFRTLAMQEDVYAMRVDGTGLRKLTDDVAKDRGPTWSADGRALAFYSNRGGRYEIWTIDRDGGDLRQRTSRTLPPDTTGMAVFPVWSPDGRSIVYSTNNDVVRFALADQPVESDATEIVPIDRGTARNILPMTWSPDGRKIAGVPIGENGQLLDGIVVHDLAAASTQWIHLRGPAPPSGLGAFPTLSWLSDSRRGVLRYGNSLFLVDTDSGVFTILLDGFHPDGGVARLSGDGRWIYMLDTRDEGDLWMAGREAPR